MRPSNNPRKLIRDYRFRADEALELRDGVVASEDVTQRHGPGNVIPPYYPRRPIPAGDPLSPSGTQVELSELADDVIDAIGTGGGAQPCFARDISSMTVPTRTTCFAHEPLITGTLTIQGDGTFLVH